MMTTRKAPRRFLAVLVSVSLIFGMVPLVAYAEEKPDAKPAENSVQATVTSEDQFTYDIDKNKNEVSIKGYKGSSSKVVIPQTIQGATVVEAVFAESSSIKSIDAGAATSLRVLRYYHTTPSLTSINVSNNTALEELTIKGSKLASLDVSKCKNLKVLECFFFKLAALDVSKNTALEELTCYANQLASLDVSKNTKLKKLMCAENELKTLNVGNNPALKELDCSLNQLASLDTGALINLKELLCDGNQLTSLDLSKNSKLTDVRCDENRLEIINVKNCPDLVSLSCFSNNLATLDVSKNKKLKYLTCAINSLRSLNLKNNPALLNLSCRANKLVSLDVSKNKKLEHLVCDRNDLTTLDVSKNTALDWLDCDYNKLVSLKLNTKIRWVNCKYNSLTSLDISKLNSLTNLYCKENYIQDTSKIQSWLKKSENKGSVLPQKKSPYKDVPKKHWAIGYIASAKELGFMTGDAKGKTFRPDASISRAEVVTALWKAAGKPKSSKKAKFNDLDADWYKPAIAWAVEQGITTGYSGTNKFGPNDPVTREQFVTFVARTAKARGNNVKAKSTKAFDAMPDKKKTSNYAVAPMKWAMEQKIISGVGGKTISPRAGATRAEVATMMVRAQVFIS